MASLSFHRGKLEGGGWIMDIIWSPDGLTGIIRTDVYCPWIWEPSLGAAGEWAPLINATSMPSGDAKLGNNGIGWGCYAIDVARSNSQILYAVFPGIGSSNTVYKSTNRGTTWTATSLTPMTMTVQSNYRSYGKKMMIHPTNPDIVIVTNNAGEAYRTANGGTNWTQISGLPAGDDPVIQWDLSDGTICYLGWRTGDNRLYRSTDSGATFSQMTGGPDNIKRITSGVNGKIYMTAEGVTNNVWRLVGTTFTNLSLSTLANSLQMHTIAVSPVDPDRVTAGFSAGNIETSLDGGDTWGGMYGNFPLREASDDVPWLEWTKEESMTSGDISYDPITEDKLWFAEGIGVWYTTPPLDDAQPTWTSMTRGQSELIINDARWPPGKRPSLTTQDRSIFRLNDFSTNPPEHGPGRTVSLQHSYGMDYASSDPNYIAVVNGGGPGLFYTDDDHATYNAFTTQGTGSGFQGSIAALTPLNLVLCPNNNGYPSFTTDGGATWTLCTFPAGVPVPPDAVSGFGAVYYLNNKYVCADRVNGKFYAINSFTKDAYVSVDGGENFTKTADNIFTDVGENQQLIAVPGQAGHLFLAQGITNDQALRRTKNGDSASATWETVANTSSSWAIGFSAPAPGQSYPAILLAGKCNGDSEHGIYLSVDDCETWVLQTRFPNNEMDIVRAMAGNPDTYGEFIFGGAAGYFYTTPAVSGKCFGLQF